MSEPSLHELQQWMKSKIRPAGSPASSEFDLQVLNPQRDTPGDERLSVYAIGYLERTREALAEVYEAVHHVLGESVFRELAHDYAQRYPSHDYNLNLIGRHLSAFLSTSPLTQQLPFLPDLATLEWLVCQAFHAFEQPPLDPQTLAALSLHEWDQARLIFQPSVGLVASRWPIVDIWNARTRPPGEVDIDLLNRPQRVLLFRHHLQVRCELIAERQYVLLGGLLGGRTLGDVCGELAMRAGGTSLPTTEWFSRWTRQGLIVRCERAAGESGPSCVSSRGVVG